jgi:hypothetical protein
MLVDDADFGQDLGGGGGPDERLGVGVQTGRPMTSPRLSMTSSPTTWNSSACTSNYLLACAGPNRESCAGG